jgi:hypothetical protein
MLSLSERFPLKKKDFDIGVRVWAVVKAFVLLGRLLLMERPRDRYCITFSRPPGANKLVNDCCGKNLGYVAGRRFPHTARSYFSSGS